MATLASEVHSQRVQSLRFDDMDAMALAMTGDHVEFLPFQPGLFDGRFYRIDLNGFELKQIVHAPALIHGAVRHDHVSLNLMARPTGGMTVNSNTFDASTLLVLSEGATIQAICPAEQDRIRITFHAEAFHQMIDAYGIWAFPRGGHQMLRLHQDQADRLTRTFVAMTDLADSLPDLFAVPGLDKALSEECHRLLAGALSGTKDRLECPRQTRVMTQQVRAADDFLHAHIDRPIYTDELCAALHVSARTLHQSFAAVYGMSPHGYLKRRRLALARRALRLARKDHAMVKSVALAHGFWHLGRFAHDYTAMFGEMPSETLGRSRSRTEPAAV